ncbi:hypothetical protein EJ08DRAFT_593973 [Tothia fuscella]|uniref:Uncharacterized protein n=1 Tax=Tothia fuscella TaxID=1048955 RepID=A0A9P4NL61_9PEZI|nr:hypothetical protein EJ08DRAFT_593973 [Tothia fuscella]
MVLLTMTPAVSAAVKVYLEDENSKRRREEPSLDAPQAGNPISHGQLIDISKYLKAHPDKVAGITVDGKQVPVYLNELMRGCALYTPPSELKAELSFEYKALMARLRKDEELRNYERMLNPLPPSEALTSKYPAASYGHLFPPTATELAEDDEVTYADINRQMALIANVLISIIACSVAIWKVAWHWNTPERLALSMAGSIVVAAAEVAIYMGYIGRVAEAKAKEKKKVEKKTIQESWVIEGKKAGGKQKSATTGVAESVSSLSGLRMRGSRAEK